MKLTLVPIPPDALTGTAHVWLPFLQKISERSRCPVEQHVQEIMSGAVQIHLAWEPETKTAHALAGVRHMKRGEDIVAEVIWATGSGREHWFPLLKEIEAYHRESGCRAIRAIARLGWKRALEESGYRASHILLEKDLG